MTKSGFVLINGFDRSGTSAISQCIAAHPQMELIMQPFNSGSVREKMYEVLDETNASEADVDFFKKLEANILEESYIKSQWHLKYSSTQNYVPGKIHLIKTTINHLTQKWVKDNFTEIDSWGIWRDPYENLNSILANDFQDAWYTDALVKLKPTVLNHKDLNEMFGRYFSKKLSPWQELALFFSVRSYFFFSHLDKDKFISYQIFKIDPNKAVEGFYKQYNLEPFDIRDTAKADLNIIGQRQKHTPLIAELKKDYLLEEILNPTIALVNAKF